MSSLALQLIAGRSAPAVARRSIESLDSVPAERLPDVVLLVSELVTNSVRHGSAPGGSIGMRVDVSEARIRVEVEDGGAGFDLDARDAGRGGVGLRLVKQLADRWGVSPSPEKVVWFEMDLGTA